MSVTVFLVLLTAFATFTSLITESVKKFMDSLNIKYATNVVVLIIALLVGILGTSCYYLVANIAFTVINIIYILALSIANWLGAMIGYDKVKQAIEQLGKWWTLYSWEISETLKSHGNVIGVKTYIDICNTSPQITRIKYEPFSDTFEMWSNDDYWKFQIGEKE